MWKTLLGSLAVIAVSIGAVALAGSVFGSDETIVVKIVDGDTIDVSMDGDARRVRLLNIDTPEIGRDGEPSECLAEDARVFLERLIPVGTEVTLEYDVERMDKYGRELAGVFKEETLVNAEVARAGLAKAIKVGPNEKFYPTVLDAEQSAAKKQWESVRLVRSVLLYRRRM